MLDILHRAGLWSLPASVPVCLLVGYALWWALERPSIEWSRQVGRISFQPPVPGRRSEIPVIATNASNWRLKPHP